jgi:hypothetical protein
LIAYCELGCNGGTGTDSMKKVWKSGILHRRKNKKMQKLYKNSKEKTSLNKIRNYKTNWNEDIS